MEEVIGHLEGETLAKMIDFLDKEMVRLIDERKIHALILLAERERKLKEAQEGGRRHKEEEIRRINDEIFKQVHTNHSNHCGSNNFNLGMTYDIMLSPSGYRYPSINRGDVFGGSFP